MLLLLFQLMNSSIFNQMRLECGYSRKNYRADRSSQKLSTKPM